MKFTILTGLILVFGLKLHAQDYTLPLTSNTELQHNLKVVSKNENSTFDSTLIYITDTLTLPFFDEFSRNNFQQFDNQLDDPEVSSQLYYSLLDPDNETPLTNDVVLTDQATYFLTVDLVNDTSIYDYFDSTTFLYNDLSSYPVTYQARYGYPPYRIVDTITANNTIRDTFWIEDPRFKQDSARIFIAQLNDPTKNWLNEKAYHNYRFAKEPWTLGVVTFDGLDEFGQPYIFGPTNITMTCDTLLSKPIDLSSNNPSDSIYFSFLYQTEGYGDPTEETDSLFLDFYNPTENEWQRIWRAGGARLSDFKVAHIPLKDPSFFENGFQFRFMNYGSPAGALDHFHVDYVNFRTLSGYQDTLFKDFAFVYPLSSLLNDYISVPWKHYKNNLQNKMSNEVQVVVRNGSELPENNQNGTVRIFYKDQEEVDFTLNATLLSSGNINYAPRSTNISYHDFSSGYAFDPLVNDTSAQFNWIANASAQFPSYPLNDSTFGSQVFKNYYAYDDGTAEKAYGVFGVQSELAYRFNGYQADSLIAVQIHFAPSVEDVSNNLFLLAIWDDNNGQPGSKIYEDQFFFPKLPVYANEKNKFHTYFFDDTARIAVGETFYVGWRQIDEERLNIGFDVNHNNSEHIFWSIDGGSSWNNSSFPGSLMMRPVVTSNLDYTLNIPKTVKETHLVDFTVYPNPVSSYFKLNIDGFNSYSVTILDINGRIIDVGDSAKTFYTDHYQKGIYFVSLVQNGHPINTKKLIIH